MMLPTAVALELSAAIGRVNDLWESVPDESRPVPNAERWRELEAEVNAAVSAGNLKLAFAAIRSWEAFAAQQLTEAGVERGGGVERS